MKPKQLSKIIVDMVIYHFVFFDFDELLVFFLLDYIAVMGLFVFIGHYLSMMVRRIGADKN